MASNRGVVFLGPNHVEVQSIDYPKLENPAGKKINHGVILKVVSTNSRKTTACPNWQQEQ
jgi:glutathione-independent formaldehyde dehydrogenase